MTVDISLENAEDIGSGSFVLQYGKTDAANALYILQYLVELIECLLAEQVAE